MVQHEAATGAFVTLRVAYVCATYALQRPLAIVNCSYMDAAATSGGPRAHHWASRECTPGGLVQSCVPMLRTESVSGRDQDWEALAPGEAAKGVIFPSGGMSWRNTFAESTGHAFSASYLCPPRDVLPATTLHVCTRDDPSFPNLPATSRTIGWSAADCAGSLPAGTCAGGLSWASASGTGDRDWQAVLPGGTDFWGVTRPVGGMAWSYVSPTPPPGVAARAVYLCR